MLMLLLLYSMDLGDVAMQDKRVADNQVERGKVGVGVMIKTITLEEK